MKILQINKFLYLKGGSEKYFLELSELLKRNGHRVINWGTDAGVKTKNDALLLSYNDYSQKENILRETKKAIRVFYNRGASKNLEAIIKTENPDVAHLHNVMTHFSPSIFFTLKKHRIPIIMTLHDYKLFCPNYKFYRGDKVCYDCPETKSYLPCLKHGCVQNSFFKSLGGYLEAVWCDFLGVKDKVDTFLAPSYFIKEKALEAGIPKRKIFYLPNFIDFEEAGARNGKTQQEKYFLYFGRISPEKGVELLIKNFLEVNKKYPQWRLKILGEGPLKLDLKRTYQHRPEIEFSNEEDESRIKQMVKRSHGRITPSLWPENAPYSILETIALNRPIIASNLGGNVEMLRDYNKGFLFDPNIKNDLAKKIIALIEKNISGEKNQIKNITDFSPGNHYKRLLKVYKDLYNKSKNKVGETH